MEFYYLREINKLIPIFKTADEWSLDSVRDYPKSKYIQQILEGIAINPDDSPRMIVYKIGKYVATQLEKYRGPDPIIDAYAYSPDILLKKIQNGETEVYCTHHAVIFAQMALQAGLPTRVIQTKTKGDAAPVYKHTLVEVFLTDENQWVVVDLQKRYALVVDENTHQPLSLYELIRAVRNGNTFDVVRSDANTLHFENNDRSDRYNEYFGGENLLFYSARLQPLGKQPIFNWWQHCGIYCKVAEF